MMYHFSQLTKYIIIDMTKAVLKHQAKLDWKDVATGDYNFLCFTWQLINSYFRAGLRDHVSGSSTPVMCRWGTQQGD